MSILFEPCVIGSVRLRNRIIYSAMDLRSGDGDGLFNDRSRESAVERARGGAALVYAPGVECRIYRGDCGTSLCLEDDAAIPGMRRFVEEVKAAGAAAGIQIGARGTRTAGQEETLAPTSMRFGYERRVPREIRRDEIHSFVQVFAETTGRAKEAGFDVIELHACTGKLLSMFLSPYSNRREDEYGGSLENRMRFPLEVLNAMLAEAGNIPIVLRLTVDDMLPGGIELAEGCEMARRFCAAGAAAIQASGGTQERIWNISPCYRMKEGYLIPAARAVKQVVDKPVIAMGKLGDPKLAEHVLESGAADAVSLGRPLLADPYWPEKVRKGEADLIRRCVGCLSCFSSCGNPRLKDYGSGCTVNPSTLRERSFAIVPAREKKRILVAGAGLAGMEAARVLARRGHEVILMEKAEAPGGQWRIASAGAHKHDYRAILPWYERELRRAGVEIRFGCEVDVRTVASLGVDCTVVATGAEPNNLRVFRLGGCSPKMVQACDVLMGKAEVGQRVVVVGGRYIGMEAAVLLAASGRHVSLVEACAIGHGTNPRLFGFYRDDLVRYGVYLYPDSPVLRLTAEGVDVAHCDALLSLPADTVVTAVGTHPVQELYDALIAAGMDCRIIGDARQIGDALFAVREGAELGREL